MARAYTRPRALRLAAVALLAAAAAASSEKLVAHIIPHSHCDPGWLESFELYYTSQVNQILSSVLREVRAAPHRRFVWAESSFFMRYFESQSRDTQQQWRELVASGQVEFVGGGWVQNDEANPSYDAVLSQLAEGHEYLLTLFGAKPRIAWSIDPFGSSSATAAIAALAGYDALVINRIEHGVKDALKARAAMEFVWKPYATSAAVSPIGGDDGDAHVPSYSNVSIFTHVLHTHYSAPRGFDFENPEGIAIHAGNVASRAQELGNQLRARALAYRTSHLLVPFGDDFKFQDAAGQFRNMDQVLDYVAAHNTDPSAGSVYNLELRYSTLSEYFEAVWGEAYTGEVHPAPEAKTAASTPSAAALDADGDGAIAGKIVFPLVGPTQADGGADWFPYADNDQSWWVGYYDSRPLLKQMIRRAFYSVRGADALLALVRPWAGEWQTLARGIVSTAASHIRGVLNASSEDDASLAAQVAAWEPFFSAAPYSTFSWLQTFQRIESARLDAALCLHHDAITGTSRSHVVDDYIQRMATAVRDAHAAVADMASLALGGLSKHMLPVLNSGGAAAAPRAPLTSLAPAPLTHVPHILPIADTLDYAHLHVDATTQHVKGALASLPAHPIVVYNPTAWRRTVVVSVLVDVGTHAAAAAGVPADSDTACTRSSWPIGIVVNDHRRAVRSQWRAVVEAGDMGKASLAAYTAANKDGINVQAGPGRSAPLEPLRDAADTSRSGSTARVEQVATGVRYELTFEAVVPAYGLVTFFAAAAWRLVDSAADRQDAPCQLPTAPGAADAFTAPLTTWVHLPGLQSVIGAPAARDSASAPPRLLAIEAPVDKTATEPAPFILENTCLRVEVDARTGMIAALTHKQPQPATSGASVTETPTPVRMRVTQSLAVYNTQRSGAYMFIPVGAPNPLNANVDDPEGVTVSITAATPFESTASTPSMVQEVRVTGPRFSQTIRLTDTLSRSILTAVEVREACADPLVPDGALDIRPTVSARGNEELVMLLDTSLDVSHGQAADKYASPNVRDQTSADAGTPAYPNIMVADAIAGPDAAAAMAKGGFRQLVDAIDGACVTHSAPHGWWTSDGLALLRRRPAHASVGDGDIQRYYYPLNTLTRLSGAVATDATAWLTLYAAQPFGTSTRITTRSGAIGSRLEVMLHRHLTQDDGRGLSTGVDDNTVITVQLSLHVGAEHHSPCGTHPPSRAAGGGSLQRTVDGAGAAHEDWLWTWATRAAIHHATHMTLHADLIAITGSTAPSTSALKHVAPPSDGSTSVSSTPLLAKAESALAIGEWIARFATRFVPIQSDGWYLSPHSPREDAYAPDLLAMCSRAGTVASQVCHHLAADDKASPHSHGASHAGLPPWMHVLTLQVRDAVTDDVVVRLQNFGGPASVVDIEALLGGSHKPRTRGSAWYAAAVSHTEGAAATGTGKADATVYAHTPLRVRSMRRRSLTLNRHEGYASALDGGARAPGHRHRLSYPSMLLDEMAATRASSISTRFPLALAGVFESLHAAPEAIRKDITSFLGRMGAVNVATRFAASEGVSIADMLGTGEKQNTNEDGVFLSDAALKKKAEDDKKRAAAAGVRGRILLALPAADAASSPAADLDITIAPASVRTFIAVVDADSPDPDDLVRTLLASIDMPARAAAAAKALPAAAVNAPAAVKVSPAAKSKRAVASTPAFDKAVTPAAPAIDVHPANEALAAVVDRIKSVVRNTTLRDQMLTQVQAGRALTAAQDALLLKLSRKTQRSHAPPAPSNLAGLVDSILKRDAGGDKCLPGSPCEPTPAVDGSLTGKDMMPARIPFEGVPAADPWPREGESEQSLRRLLRTLQSSVHGISTGWVSSGKKGVIEPSANEVFQFPSPAAAKQTETGLIDTNDVYLAPAVARDAATAVSVDDDGDDFIVSLAIVVILAAACVLYCCRSGAGGRSSKEPLLPTQSGPAAAAEAGVASSLFGFFTVGGARNALKRVVNSSKVQ